ncbi:MAG: two-component regulator propeller domain-containing protein, partial [Planctomycetota bacterium]
MRRISALAAAASTAALHPAAAQELNPEHVVRSFLQDSNGHYWFGTWSSGVYRFDGQDLTLFTQSDGLNNNQVRSILEGKDGTVWFETATGVSRFDGETISRHTERDYRSKNDWRLGPDDLWFKGDNFIGVTQSEAKPGVYRYDGTTFRYHTFPGIDPTDNGGSVTGIAQHRDGRIWIATYGGVIGYDGASF